jgi:hypothetical protein
MAQKERGHKLFYLRQVEALVGFSVVIERSRCFTSLSRRSRVQILPYLRHSQFSISESTYIIMRRHVFGAFSLPVELQIRYVARLTLRSTGDVAKERLCSKDYFKDGLPLRLWYIIALLGDFSINESTYIIRRRVVFVAFSLLVELQIRLVAGLTKQELMAQKERGHKLFYFVKSTHLSDFLLSLREAAALHRRMHVRQYLESKRLRL